MLKPTFTLLVVASTLLLAAATPLARRDTTECNTTDGAQCCQTTTTAAGPGIAQMLTNAGILVSSLDTPVIINCSPIRIVGVVSGSSWCVPVCRRGERAVG